MTKKKRPFLPQNRIFHFDGKLIAGATMFNHIFKRYLGRRLLFVVFEPGWQKLRENLYAYFCSRRKAVNFCHPVLSCVSHDVYRCTFNSIIYLKHYLWFYHVSEGCILVNLDFACRSNEKLAISFSWNHFLKDEW